MVSNGRARAAVVSVLSVAAQYQHVWGFSAVPPLPRISQPQHSNIFRLHAGHDYEEQRPSLSRAELLRLQVLPPGVFGALVVGAAAKPSSAALPTTEDYAFGTGSKVKRSPSQDEMSLQLPLAASSVNPKNLVEVLGAISIELDRVENLVKKEVGGRLDATQELSIGSPTLGLGSVGDVARTLGVSKSQASGILEASMEAGLTLKEVEDTVFSNTRTLEFFNSADLKQVEALAKNATPTDLTEPLELLSDTRQLVNGVKDMAMIGTQ